MAASHARARFFTVAEAAELMRVSTMTVYRFINGGDLPAVRLGKSFRIREDDLDAFLAARYTSTA
jgi:excisionase family DNA binding protein